MKFDFGRELHVSVDGRRDPATETLRGLALVLMVIGHVIGDSAARGLRVPDGGGLRYFYFLTEDLRMPLFTIISGFVYAMRPFKLAQWQRFSQGKLRRILLPLITVSTLYFMIQQIVPTTHTPPGLSRLWTIYLFSYEHFWFLQAILLIFVTISLIDGFGVMQTERAWIACLVATTSLLIVPLESDFMSLWGYAQLLPFFILGCGLKRFPLVFSSRMMLGGLATIFLAAFVIRQLGWFGIINPENRLISLVIGFTGGVLLVRMRIRIDSLAWLGTYSFTVYLLHVFGTAGSRIVLTKLGCGADGILLIGGLAAGLAIPIVAHSICSRNHLTRMLVLGLKNTNKVKRSMVHQ
jgi:glucans biosynthesis protein C